MKKILFLLLCLSISSVICAQTAEKEDTDDSSVFCVDCDSLYNLVCFTRDTLIYGEDVDRMPAYPGGPFALRNFIATNTQYPKVFKEINFQGVVVVRFIID